MSIIPRKLRRYRRENPYSNRGLFIFLDLIDTLVKFSAIGALFFAGYFVLNHFKPQPTGPQTAESRTLPATKPVALDSEVLDLKETTDSLAARQKPEIPDTQTITAEQPNPTGRPASASAKPEVQPRQIVSTSAPSILDGNHAIDWIEQQNEAHYLIQFASSPDKSALTKFATENLDSPAIVYPFKRTPTNRPVYGLASGIHPSLDSAQASLRQLPSALQSFKPWIRPIGKLQLAIERTLN